MIDALERSADTIPVVVRAATTGLRAGDERWKPAADAWSILEIVQHLADEEERDFRPRLERTLRDPAEAWDPIDPEGWAVERRYNEGDLEEALNRFIESRRASIAWLKGLRGVTGPDWEQAHEHPLGRLRAGDLLAAWVAHDTLHLRQITRRVFQIIQRDAGDYSTDYAGSW